MNQGWILWLLACHGPNPAREAIDRAKQADKACVEAPPSDRATWTCPMHPEIVSHEPGICPKCKMDLVKSEVKHE